MKMRTYPQSSDKIHQGGGVAAPLGGQIFSEILPYLEVSQGNQDEVEVINQVTVPELEEKTVKEARQIAKESNINLVIENEPEELDEENVVIKEQTPKAGIVINEGSNVYCGI